MRQAIFISLVFILLVFSGCAKQYIITDPLEEYIPVTVSCNVRSIGDELPDDFPPEKKPSLEVMNQFKSEIISAMKKRDLFATISADNPECEYEVAGSILDYKAGSGFVRFLIGLGIGSAKVTVRLSLIDKTDNNILFSGNFNGSVSSEFEKGDKMFKKVAVNFAKALQKELKKLDKKRESNG